MRAACLLPILNITIGITCMSCGFVVVPPVCVQFGSHWTLMFDVSLLHLHNQATRSSSSHMEVLTARSVPGLCTKMSNLIRL